MEQQATHHLTDPIPLTSTLSVITIGGFPLHRSLFAMPIIAIAVLAATGCQPAPVIAQPSPTPSQTLPSQTATGTVTPKATASSTPVPVLRTPPPVPQPVCSPGTRSSADTVCGPRGQWEPVATTPPTPETTTGPSPMVTPSASPMPTASAENSSTRGSLCTIPGAGGDWQKDENGQTHYLVCGTNLVYRWADEPDLSPSPRPSA